MVPEFRARRVFGRAVGGWGAVLQANPTQKIWVWFGGKCFLLGLRGWGLAPLTAPTHRHTTDKIAVLQPPPLNPLPAGASNRAQATRHLSALRGSHESGTALEREIHTQRGLRVDEGA